MTTSRPNLTNKGFVTSVYFRVGLLQERYPELVWIFALAKYNFAIGLKNRNAVVNNNVEIGTIFDEGAYEQTEFLKLF